MTGKPLARSAPDQPPAPGATHVVGTADTAAPRTKTAKTAAKHHTVKAEEPAES